MRQFKDGKDRVWEVAVTVGTLRRVRNDLRINDEASAPRFELMDLANVGSPTFERVMSDPVLLCDVLYAVCQPQAKALDVSADAFAELLAGDVLGEATRALLEAIADFSPSPAIRAALGKEINALITSTERVQRRLADSIDEATLTTAIETAYEATLRRPAATSGRSASPQPASSASSPGATRSPNSS